MIVDLSEPCSIEDGLGTETPEQIEQVLSFSFPPEQAGRISGDVYQPLLELIRYQQHQIDELKAKIE